MRFRRWPTGITSYLLFIIPCVVIVVLIKSFPNVNPDDVEVALTGKLSLLENRVAHLAMLDQEKRKDFLFLQSRMAEMLDAAEKANFSLDTALSTELWKPHSGSLNRSAPIVTGGKMLLVNLSTIASGTGTALSVPSMGDHLPHILRNPDSLTPAVHVTKHRRSAELVIGIPTIKRPKISYLITTLRSVIDNLKPEERHSVLIVVFIGELGMTPYVSEQALIIESEFPEFIASGMLEIIVPSAQFYPPDLDRIPPTFDDKQDRMTWRTKQNLDYAYLMMYCQSRGTFYMQLEDDVITKPDYLSKIRSFAVKQASSNEVGSKNWFLLEFSSLGFIGKMFKTKDLPLVVDFLLMFHR